MWNQTFHVKFIIVGFSELPQHQLELFVLFCIIYILTLLGNILLLVTIWLNKNLRTPMYFFLGNLSLLDIFYVSVTMPKLFSIFLLGEKTITLNGCITQLNFFQSLGSSEFFLLAAMAYDRYVAICHPLRYTSLMTYRACMILSLGSWFGGFLISLPSVVMISNLEFCKKNTIRHFFCDLSPLLMLSCTDTSSIEQLDFVAALVVFMPSLGVTGISYVCIFYTIAKIPSAKGKHKAFCTCASHLIVVSMLYATTIFVYAQPKAIATFETMFMSIFYIMVIPVLNPIIYSLRNREVRQTLSGALCFFGNFKMERLT